MCDICVYVGTHASIHNEEARVWHTVSSSVTLSLFCDCVAQVGKMFEGLSCLWLLGVGVAGVSYQVHFISSFRMKFSSLLVYFPLYEFGSLPVSSFT